jgi:hypothetical protein
VWTELLSDAHLQLVSPSLIMHSILYMQSPQLSFLNPAYGSHLGSHFLNPPACYCPHRAPLRMCSHHSRPQLPAGDAVSAHQPRHACASCMCETVHGSVPNATATRWTRPPSRSGGVAREVTHACDACRPHAGLGPSHCRILCIGGLGGVCRIRQDREWSCGVERLDERLRTNLQSTGAQELL